jgi:hypothetical protein
MFYCNDHDSPAACRNDTSNRCMWQDVLGIGACTSDISLAAISDFLVSSW